MLTRRSAHNLSVEELEQLLRLKRRESRIERFQQLSQQGHAVSEALLEAEIPARVSKKVVSPKASATNVMQAIPTAKQKFWGLWRRSPAKPRSKFMDRVLLSVEVLADRRAHV